MQVPSTLRSRVCPDSAPTKSLEKTRTGKQAPTRDWERSSRGSSGAGTTLSFCDAVMGFPPVPLSARVGARLTVLLRNAEAILPA